MPNTTCGSIFTLFIEFQEKLAHQFSDDLHFERLDSMYNAMDREYELYLQERGLYESKDGSIYDLTLN